MKLRYIKKDGFNYIFEFEFRGKKKRVECDGLYFSWEKYPFEYGLTVEEKRFFLKLCKEIREGIETEERSEIDILSSNLLDD